MNLKNLWSFSGRINRRNYWIEYAALITASFLLLPVGTYGGVIGAAIQLVGSLGIVIGLLAVSARRLHDTGRSGWYQLWWVGLTALLGILAVLFAEVGASHRDALIVVMLCGVGMMAVGIHSLYVLGVLKGDLEANQYGEPGSSCVFPYWKD